MISVKKPLQASTALARKLKALELGKESARQNLVKPAKKLAATTRENEGISRKPVAKAKQLAANTDKIAQANKYARSLIEASLDPLVTISLSGKITDVNEATIAVTGIARLKLIGTDFSKYFTEPKKALAGYKKVFREGLVTDYPLTIRSKTGKLTNVLYNASVYKDDKGIVLGVFAAARDVTETMKAAEKIAQANKYARSLIEASLDPLVTISLSGKITDVNEATIAVTGIARLKLIGTDFSKYFTEPKKALAGYKKVFREGLVTDYPLTIRSRTGRLTNVLYNASVYKDDKGIVLGVFAAARDYTRAKKANELLVVTANQLAVAAKEKESVIRTLAVTAGRLKKSHLTLENKVLKRTKDLEQIRSKHEAILTSIGDGLVVVDKEGRITYINKSFEDMLGWKRQEIIGKIMDEIVHQEYEDGYDVPFTERMLTKVLAGQKFETNSASQLYYIRKDKSRFPASSIVAPVILSGKMVGAVKTFRDITKEKSIDKAKTEFVSLASHQLRTPLSTVNWYSEMLLAGDIGEVTAEQKKYLEEIYNSNQRMVDLVNTLLDVSRIELGTFDGESKPTNIETLVESVVAEQKIQINEKGLNFLYVYDNSLPLIQVDPKLLRMVIQNLLSNAIKYTPASGKIEITLSLDKKRNVLLQVADTGYGIPNNQQERIFTKLFRADNVMGKDTEGTGLGLYIAKSIIEQAGGELWFESEENIGTTFYATVPVGKIRKGGAATTIVEGYSY